MKNKNTIKLANFTNGVTDIQYDYSYDDNGNVSNIKSSMVDYKFVYNDKAKIIEKWQNGNLLESKEYDGNNLDSILYLNNYKIDYIYGGDNLIYEVYGNDDVYVIEGSYDNIKITTIEDIK